MKPRGPEAGGYPDITLVEKMAPRQSMSLSLSRSEGHLSVEGDTSRQASRFD
jgi:hypothetical protein